MSDRALRRPLLWLLLAYMAALVAWRSRGGLLPVVAPEDEGFDRRTALVQAIADGPAREDRAGWKVEARASAADGRPFRYGVLLRWRRDADPDALPWPGQVVTVEARLRRPRQPRNPGDFDERGFLAERGIAWIADVKAVRDAGPVSPWSPRYWAERLHRSARRRLRAALPLDRARLLEGLMLGYKGALSPALDRAVRDAGLIHLIVPSGAKVALALAAACLLARLLRLGPWPTAAIEAALGALLVLAAGGEPPYWRAYAAAVLLRCCRAAGRDVDAFQALIAAAWLELSFRPAALFSAGFQMSYAAVASLLAFGPALWRVCRGLRPRALRAAVLAFGASAAVEAALWPIFAQTFGRGSLAGVAVNAAAIPLAPALAAGGWLLWAWPARGLAWLMSAAMAGFERACFAAAALPGAAVTLAAWPSSSVVAYYLALLGLSRRGPRRIAAWLLVAAVVRAGAAWADRASGDLRVVYLAVPPRAGKARRAALVTFDGRRTWLVGEAPPALVARACRAYGLDGVDGEVPYSPGLRLCRGPECLDFGQSAIIALPSEIHVRFPR